MKNNFKNLALFALLGSSLYAIEFKASGDVEFFSKVGFNQKRVNFEQNLYPTDTWGAVSAAAQIDFDFLSQEQKDNGHSLTGSIGGRAGGVIFDAMKDITLDSRFQNYFFGKEGGGNSIVANAYINQNFVLYNLYLEYIVKKGDHSFSTKVGRYRSKAQFHSGYTQGFEFDYNYKGLNLWWFSSYGRAFAYTQWMYDFYQPKMHGNTYYGTHAFKPSYSFDSGFYISPFIYFNTDFYVAPMLEMSYTSNKNFKGEGFNSITKVIFMAPFHIANGLKDWRYMHQAGKNGQTISIDQEFNYNNWKFGGGWYQNFGNANAHIGTYGNAALGAHWDFWTNTAYDWGALTNAISKDAKTGYLFLGANHGKVSWDILGRITRSIRADEEAIPLNIYYNINKNVSIWFKVEWQQVTLHKGFLVGDKTGYELGYGTHGPDGAPKLTKNSKQDRSHAFVQVTYKF